MDEREAAAAKPPPRVEAGAKATPPPPRPKWSQELGTCMGCGKKIEGGTVVEALNGKFHAACFKCSSCATQLGGGTPFNQAPDGKLVCAKCHGEKHAPRCAGCSKLITGTIVTALGKQWHKECLACAKCKKPLTSSFSVADGKPVCPACAFGKPKAGGRSMGGAKSAVDALVDEYAELGK